MKVARLLPMLAGILMSVAGILPAAEQLGVVNDARLNVRGKPNLVGEVITQVRKGEQVTVLEEITDKHAKTNEPSKWLKIAMPANTPLWISTNYVDAGNQITANKLNVRGGQGENYSIVGTLKKGDTVKPIRAIGDWMEIETPPGAYGFVAAEFITITNAPVELVQNEPKQPARVETPKPAKEKTPELVKTEEKPVEVVKTEEVPKEPEPTPLAETPTEPVAVQNPPVIAAVPPPGVTPVETSAPTQETTEAPTEPDLPKRVVTREGVVKRAKSIQSPTHFSLENQQTSELMNYLHATDPDINLKLYTGYKVIVTGEEFIDPRWPAIPLIHVEKIQLP